jgi:hypothetical protein
MSLRLCESLLEKYLMNEFVSKLMLTVNQVACHAAMARIA